MKDLASPVAKTLTPRTGALARLEYRNPTVEYTKDEAWKEDFKFTFDPVPRKLLLTLIVMIALLLLVLVWPAG